MGIREDFTKPTTKTQKPLEEIVESTYRDFLGLRPTSATYKILRYIFWQHKAISPKKLSKALNLTPSTVRDAVRQLHKMGLLRCPRRGAYEPNRDRCLAMLLHVHRMRKDNLPKR